MFVITGMLYNFTCCKALKKNVKHLNVILDYVTSMVVEFVGYVLYVLLFTYRNKSHPQSTNNTGKLLIMHPCVDEH